jgi:hypothetical protein
MFDWTQLWSIVGLPVLSGLAGFAQNNWENFMADNKLDKYEWKKIVETVLKLGIPSILLWLTLQGFNIDVDAWVPTITIIAGYWINRLFSNKETPPVVA